MSIPDRAIDYGVALGKGIYSVGEDLVLGAQRTGQGLGTSGGSRVSEIGAENRLIAGLVKGFFQHASSSKGSPLYNAVFHILEHYYATLPDAVFDEVVKQSNIGAAYMVGRMVIGKKLAEQVALRISASIAASVMFKQLAKKLGIAGGASATGAGTPIGLLMMQGVLQRSSIGAIRLQQKCPPLYKTLKQNGNLQFVYFLVEKPMKPYIDAITKGC